MGTVPRWSWGFRLCASPGGLPHSGSTAWRSCVKVSTASFLPASDKAHDTSLIHLYFKSVVVMFAWVSPGVFSWAVLHMEGFPRCGWHGPEKQFRLQHFRRLLQDRCSTGCFKHVLTPCRQRCSTAKGWNYLSLFRGNMRTGAWILRQVAGRLPGMSSPVPFQGLFIAVTGTVNSHFMFTPSTPPMALKTSVIAS